MIGEELSQFGMPGHVIGVADEGWVLLEILIDRRMIIEKFIEVSYLRSGDVFSALIESTFSVDKPSGILSKFLSNSRMTRQKFLQFGMVRDVSRIVCQRRIVLELLGNGRMGIQEPVKVEEFLARDVLR